MNRLSIRGTALSLGVFFDVSFLLCVLWGLLAPQAFTKMAGLLELVFPGFVWLTPQSVVLGLLEAFLYGVYVAVIFVPLFNHFEGARASEVEKPAGAGRSSPREAVTPH